VIKLREISKTQKLQVATIVIVCSLIIYAIGIATNFFGSPVFSMFFIISDQTAHNVVTYVAVAIAIALTIMVLSMSLIKKRKTAFPETHNKPVIFRTNKAPNEAPVRVTPPTNNQKITSNTETDKTEQKNQSAKQPIMQPTKQSTTQIPTQPNTDKNATTNQEAVINKNKITCPNCKKEFSTPLFSIDYGSRKPKLVRLCPFCNQSLDSEPKNTAEEDLFEKYVTQLQNEFAKKP
jgi:hypothetical protein